MTSFQSSARSSGNGKMIKRIATIAVFFAAISSSQTFAASKSAYEDHLDNFQRSEMQKKCLDDAKKLAVSTDSSEFSRMAALSKSAEASLKCNYYNSSEPLGEAAMKRLWPEISETDNIPPQEEHEPPGIMIQFLPMLIFWALILPPLWRIAKRAGFNPWLSLLMLVPFVNLVVLWMFSKRPWPAIDEK